jgi:hypothetical protein
MDLFNAPVPAMLRGDATYSIRVAAEMASRQVEILALRAGKPLPEHRITDLRSTGMHAIRSEFISRLLRSSVKPDTMTIYWEHGKEFLLDREVKDVSRTLAFGGRKRVTGAFPDVWLLCYPDDAEIKQLVELELDRMVASVRTPGGQ